MVRFLFKVIIMFLLVIMSVIGLYFIPGNSDNYYGAAIDKHNLLKLTESPRIIFIGGSNLAFGLDSEMIEKKLNCSVVNMGLHAALGLEYILNEVKPYIREKDIIIISPEYAFFFSSNLINGSGETLMGLLDVNPLFIKYLTVRQIMNLINYIPDLFRWKMKSLMYKFNIITFKQDIYIRKAFNRNGDVIIHLNRDSYINNEDINNVKTNGHKRKEEDNISNVILLLNDFRLYATKKKAMVYFCFPCYKSSFYNEKEILNLYFILERKLNIKILNLPSSYVFPDDCFFDTDYHLNSKGRKIRTERIISDLQQKFVK